MNRHGVRGLGSLLVTYRPEAGPWRAKLQVNSAAMQGGLRNISLTTGVSYLFAEQGTEGPRSRILHTPGANPEHEVTVYLGKTILNSFKSEVSDAYILEYRNALSRHWTVSASYANEGDLVVMRRDGLAIQAHIGGTLASGRLLLSFGAGPHLARVWEPSADGHGDDLSNRIGLRATIGAGWKPGTDWVVRLAWNRTVTSYDRDTDLLVGGIGYTW